MNKHTFLPLLTGLLIATLTELNAAEPSRPVPQSPMQVWADYDPNQGDFKDEIISEETKNGIYNRFR